MSKKSKIIISLVWLMTVLWVFDFGYTHGGYHAYKVQASFGRHKCRFVAGIPEKISDKETAYHHTPEVDVCLKYQQKALHQYTPFPYNLIEVLTPSHE